MLKRSDNNFFLSSKSGGRRSFLDASRERERRGRNLLIIFLVGVVVSMLVFVLAMPDSQINFTNPTLANDTTASNTSIGINVLITEANLMK